MIGCRSSRRLPFFLVIVHWFGVGREVTAGGGVEGAFMMAVGGGDGGGLEEQVEAVFVGSVCEIGACVADDVCVCC